MTTQTGTQFSLMEVIRHAADGWFIVDQNHCFVLVSESFERLIGRSAAELLGQECRCGDVVQCHDVQGRPLKGFLCPARGLFDGTMQTTTQRMQLQRAQAEAIWVETAYHVIRDPHGLPRYVCGTMRDISESMARETDLLQTIERLRAAAVSATPTRQTHVDDINLDKVLARVEADTIRAALGAAGGYRHKAAELLGISRSRLYRRMEALGINPGDAH